MTEMADPMIALNKFQDHLNQGNTVDPSDLDEGYLRLYDEVPSGKRYSYVKIVNGVAQAVSIFGLDDPIDGIPCFSVGYAVNENCRGKGLSSEAVGFGIKDLIRIFKNSQMSQFYVEAVIDLDNAPSLGAARKIFSTTGRLVIETYSGKKALQFTKLYSI